MNLKNAVESTTSVYCTDCYNSTTFFRMKFRGFTFIELLFTLTLCSIVTLFCVSSWTYLRQSNERAVLIDELKSVVQYAKMQAINYGQPLVLHSLDKSQDWSSGVLLTSLNNTEALYQWEWHHRYWHVAWFGANGAKKIVIAEKPGNSMSNGRFVITNTHSQEQILVVLNRLGRIKRVDSHDVNAQ